MSEKIKPGPGRYGWPRSSRNVMDIVDDLRRHADGDDTPLGDLMRDAADCLEDMDAVIEAEYDY